jgi:small-conductance mechanosensitive channel
MFDRTVLVALGMIIVGVLAGAGVEYLVRRSRALALFSFVAPAFFITLGIYAGALELQRGHIAPETHHTFVAVLILLVTVVLARVAGAAVARHSERAAKTIGSLSLFISVTEAFVGVVGGLVILQYLGISVAPILTAFGIGGLAVALALQDTLANFFSGIQIAASRQVHAGDVVRLDADNVGTVVDINWRNTVIRDDDGNSIIIPNQKLATAIFKNYGRVSKVRTR